MKPRSAAPVASGPRLFVGTSGYAYPAWKGSFYPADLAASKMLPFYAARLSSTELNHTFYKMPNAGQLEKSAALVPPEFRFSIKAPASITHRKDLELADELFDILAERLVGLQMRAGCLYLQLPATLVCNLTRLERFLARVSRIPTERAIELPHPSWNAPAVEALLRVHETSRVVVDVDPPDATPTPMEAPPSWGTAKAAYIRMRRDRYDNAALDGWVRRIREANPETVYVYFRHEDSGRGPKLAARFLARWKRSAVKA